MHRAVLVLLSSLVIVLILADSGWHSDSISLTEAYPLEAFLQECRLSKAEYWKLLPEAQHRQAQELPRFTSKGYFLLKLPSDLHEGVRKAFERIRETAERPETEKGEVEVPDASMRPTMTDIVGTPQELALREWLLRALQHWTGATNLTHSQTYGVRTYKRGSSLNVHVDRLRTHVLSAIIQVARKGVEREWPLDIIPHDQDKVLSVQMPPGVNCLLYESATLPHGRLEGLRAEEYSNMFVHFAPRDWHLTLQRLQFS